MKNAPKSQHFFQISVLRAKLRRKIFNDNKEILTKKDKCILNQIYVEIIKRAPPGEGEGDAKKSVQMQEKSKSVFILVLSLIIYL